MRESSDAMIFGFNKAEEKFDKLLKRLSSFENATEVTLSPLLDLNFILAKDYKAAFPQHASSTNRDQQEFIANESYIVKQENMELLSPTCCYPLFQFIQQKQFQQNQCFTVKGSCFRKEEYYESWKRERTFRMREFIYFGDLLSTENWVESVCQIISCFIVTLGIDMKLEVASDPFFDPKSIKGMLQKNQELKREIVVDGLAIASINFHLNAFCKKCNITVNGSFGYSACFGLGYNRLWYILSEKYGVDKALQYLDDLIENPKLVLSH